MIIGNDNYVRNDNYDNNDNNAITLPPHEYADIENPLQEHQFYS